MFKSVNYDSYGYQQKKMLYLLQEGIYERNDNYNIKQHFFIIEELKKIEKIYGFSVACAIDMISSDIDAERQVELHNILLDKLIIIEKLLELHQLFSVDLELQVIDKIKLICKEINIRSNKQVHCLFQENSNSQFCLWINDQKKYIRRYVSVASKMTISKGKALLRSYQRQDLLSYIDTVSVDEQYHCMSEWLAFHLALQQCPKVNDKITFENLQDKLQTLNVLFGYRFDFHFKQISAQRYVFCIDNDEYTQILCKKNNVQDTLLDIETNAKERRVKGEVDYYLYDTKCIISVQSFYQIKKAEQRYHRSLRLGLGLGIITIHLLLVFSLFSYFAFLCSLFLSQWFLFVIYFTGKSDCLEEKQLIQRCLDKFKLKIHKEIYDDVGDKNSELFYSKREILRQLSMKNQSVPLSLDHINDNVPLLHIEIPDDFTFLRLVEQEQHIDLIILDKSKNQQFSLPLFLSL